MSVPLKRDFASAPPHVRERDARRVALLTQVREHEVIRLARHRLARERRGVVIAQVPDPRRDPRLQPGTVRAVPQHVVVVVRLEHEDVERLARARDRAAHVADVVEHARPRPGRLAGHDEAHRLARVVRRRCRAHRHAWESRSSCRRRTDCTCGTGELRGARRRRRRVQLPSPALHRRLRAVHVVPVLVRHEAGVDRIRLDADRLEASRQRARAVAAVDQDPRPVALDKNRVAATAAPQHPQLHDSRSSRTQRLACAAARCRLPRSLKRNRTTRHHAGRAVSMNLSA